MALRERHTLRDFVDSRNGKASHPVTYVRGGGGGGAGGFGVSRGGAASGVVDECECLGLLPGVVAIIATILIMAQFPLRDPEQHDSVEAGTVEHSKDQPYMDPLYSQIFTSRG